jgi:hypothetical protein
LFPQVSRRASNLLNALVASALCAGSAAAQDPTTIEIHRASGAISVDGDLSDPGWEGATEVDTWYETNPGDNIPPRVKSRAWLTYDEHFFYAAFKLDDPKPESIRAPYADRDNVSSDTDYAGVILDTRNDGKTGILFLANPRGIQYDSVSDDTTGNEDSSPDFFWDSAAKVTNEGWNLEIRIPFSSLRYPKTDPRTWGIMLYRNYPREFRYQMFSTRLPRGGQCFICRENKLVGLADLPSAGHVVLAPYVNASETARPDAGVLGADLKNEPLRGQVGFDAKWTPGPNTAVDATVNPDFSQIESDVAQISADERFALFYPEKRPFFLEGIEMFATPIQAVYTRTITSPRWGLRSTGKFGSTAYTTLIADDRGGGSVILPGATGSDFINQDFRSFVAIGRVRHDLGRSFVSFLATDREIQGGGGNRVFGPDFQWRPNQKDTLTGQLLFSQSDTPVRPDLSLSWNGAALFGHGADVWWSHSTARVDGFTEVRDFTDGFRADDGFVPEVGDRHFDGEYGYTFRPQGFLRRLRPFVGFDHADARNGDVLLREYSIGLGLDAFWNSSARLRYAFDHVQTGGLLLPQRQLVYIIQTNPSRVLSGILLQGFVGQEVDFVNHRAGRGAKVDLSFVVRPTDHLELRVNEARRWLDVDTQGVAGRVFTARVDRLRATYTFNSRLFVRAIVQYVAEDRDPKLYVAATNARDGTFNGSGLLAFKLNWQSVVFLGYGDDREILNSESLVPSDRRFFVKLSYAFQR